MYYIYMIRCQDNSIYTGITTDLKRRMSEHFNKDEKCAKYTSSHDVKRLERVWSTSNRSLASKLEYNIKKLTKKEKENLIKNIYQIKDMFADKLDYTEYRDYDFKNNI